MKNIIYCTIALVLLNCTDNSTKEEKKPKDYIAISGKITNLKESVFVISDYKRIYSKTITINDDGSFSDTLKLPDSINVYTLKYGKQNKLLYLKNNHDLSLTLDTEQFDESLKYEGSIAKENNYFAAKALLDKNFNFMEFASAHNEDFEKDLENNINQKMDLLAKHSNLDSSFVSSEKESIKGFEKQMRFFHNQEVKKANLIDGIVGKPSPIFENYTTPDGELVSLDKFYGKYTYIDVWATWCKPCTSETPFLKEFMTTEAAKKMNILSISIDEDKTADKWKEMVKEDETNWVQLRADSAWQSSFIEAYGINAIPRFILLDPNGNVVNADAPRPSFDEFKTMIDELNL